ncbi:hypothetical protein GmHk_08G022976 [Glycine max]|nr:hypothetical protein GmHk_08G022976 [Glycine max]
MIETSHPLFALLINHPPVQQDLFLELVNVDDTPHKTSLGSIDYTFDRVPLTVVIVKICTPTDPTRTVDATMKRTIIEGQDCSPYMTYIHVVVFYHFPPHSKCYLNITLYNVVKVFLKEN